MDRGGISFLISRIVTRNGNIWQYRGISNNMRKNLNNFNLNECMILEICLSRLYFDFL